MRTTIRLDPALMAKAKEQSARTGETLTAMIERGLRLVLARPRRSRRTMIIRVPTSRAAGGLRPGVNLDDSAALLDIMEERRCFSLMSTFLLYSVRQASPRPWFAAPAIESGSE